MWLLQPIPKIWELLRVTCSCLGIISVMQSYGYEQPPDDATEVDYSRNANFWTENGTLLYDDISILNFAYPHHRFPQLWLENCHFGISLHQGWARHIPIILNGQTLRSYRPRWLFPVKKSPAFSRKSPKKGVHDKFTQKNLTTWHGPVGQRPPIPPIPAPLLLGEHRAANAGVTRVLADGAVTWTPLHRFQGIKRKQMVHGCSWVKTIFQTLVSLSISK